MLLFLSFLFYFNFIDIDAIPFSNRIVLILQTENSYENTVNVTAPKIWLTLVNGHLDVGIGRILHDVKVVSQIGNIASIVEVYIASNKNDIDLDGVACPTGNI